jgi:predicted TIM-barrel fold metal-dependent hydrolase
MTAMVVHGALSRFPRLKIACVENGATWVGHLFEGFEGAYKKLPQEFLEDPVVAFKRNVYVNPFWEDDVSDLVKLVGPDHILFGSDYPHPEGLRDPISYVDKLADLPREDVVKIMSGNLDELMKAPAQI